MEPESPPKDYVPRYTPAEVLRRFQFLSVECRRFVEEYNRVHPTWVLRWDHLVMLNVAQSAMDDIWRYKNYHLRDPNKRSDAVKRTAYFTKWITRFRPIYFARVLSEDDIEKAFDKKDTSLMANEVFAIHISLTTLATEVPVEEIHLEPEFFANFLYDLHYRNLSEDALLAIYELIRGAVKNETIVLKVFPAAP